MTIDRRLIAGTLGLSLLLAACGGNSSDATGAPVASQGGLATIAPNRTEAAEPTEGAEETEEAEASQDGGAASLAPGSAPDLEAMLPDEAGGVKFQKSSFDGASMGIYGAAAGLSSEGLDPILKENGKTINDVSFAIAVPADSSGTEAAMIYAFRVKGLPAEKFSEAMGVDTASMTKTKIGGKDVWSSGGGGFGVAIYLHDDVVFEVLLASDKVMEDALRQLP
jgi:hypothetical protein